jgi:1-acyl-sn-glycerol-3-phosphate acyltransferase
MTKLRSAVYALVFYPATLLFVLGCMVASLIGREPVRSVVHGWTNFHHWLVRLLGTRVTVEGAIPTGAYLIAVKHQSMFETLEMMRIARTPIVVMKRELTTMPMFGWATRAYGVIPVDRQAGAKALREMLTLGKESAASGRPILIYPEGTRTPAGESPPLQAGFSGLYKALGLPVVPVAMDSGRFWGRNLPEGTGTVNFRIGEPIPAGLKRDEIEARVHAGINALELGSELRP